MDLRQALPKRAKTNEPTTDDIFAVGTLGVIIQLLRLPDETVKVLVEGKRRARIRRFHQTEGFFMVEAEDVLEPGAADKGTELEALMRSIHATFETYVKLNKRIPPEMLISVQTIDDPARLADTIVAHLSLKLNDKQAILEMESAGKRLERLFESHAGGDRDPAGREEDPHPRQEADGEGRPPTGQPDRTQRGRSRPGGAGGAPPSKIRNAVMSRQRVLARNSETEP